MTNSDFSNKTTRLVGITVARLLVLVLVALVYIASPFTSTTGAAAKDELVGTWKGRGTGKQRESRSFDMTLTIPALKGDSFSGTLRENIYDTTMEIKGTLNGDQVSFKNTARLSGNKMVLNTKYQGTVSNGTIKGGWTCPPRLF